MNLTDILFNDIETVSQYKTFAEVPEHFKALWSRQVRQSYKDLLPAGTDVDNIPFDVLSTIYAKKAALHAEFAKIVCLAIGKFVPENGEGQPPTLKVKSYMGEEVTILNTFTAAALKAKALCAHNGKKFDFPFIARRSVINNLPVPKLLDVRDMKPWEVVNIDTQEMWRFGDIVYPSLDLICSVLGIPVKVGFDGSQVHAAFYANELKNIGDYCAQDVVAVAKVYVKLLANLSVENIVVL